eukprot:4779768-Prymnesium_polylepis.1
MIDAMAATGDGLLKDKLADELAQFLAFERIEPNVSSVIISAFKQFHHGGEYCKGRGREFMVWLKQNHPTVFFLFFERAVGARQDLKFDGCVPLFVNRVVCLEFLLGYLDCPKSENVLDKSLYTVLRCNEFVGLLRANTLWKFIFSEPFRWLSGKAAALSGMSLVKMGWVLGLVEKAMEEIVADPRHALDPTLDIFAPVAAEVPDFKEWRKELLASKVTAPDGETAHLSFQE